MPRRAVGDGCVSCHGSRQTPDPALSQAALYRAARPTGLFFRWPTLSMSAEQQIEAVADVLADIVFNGHQESELQIAIANRLHWASINYEREHRFTPRDRVDFFLAEGGIAVECKVKGGSAEIIRQLDRYMAQECVRGILLVTTKMQHRATMPAQLQGKPVKVLVFHRLP